MRAMLISSDETLDVDVVSAAAAYAITEVHADIREMSPSRGRAGLVASLRRGANSLAPSGVAMEQVKRVALQVAADDIAWGRAPLVAWRTFFKNETAELELARAEIRLRLGTPPRAVTAEEDAVATEIETQVLNRAGDAFVAARERWDLLERAVQLQAELWDDPRLLASDDARWRMRAGEDGLRRLLRRRPASDLAKTSTTQSLWRRLLAGVSAP